MEDFRRFLLHCFGELGHTKTDLSHLNKFVVSSKRNCQFMRAYKCSIEKLQVLQWTVAINCLIQSPVKIDLLTKADPTQSDKIENADVLYTSKACVAHTNTNEISTIYFQEWMAVA